jgi:uncharacterized membrane protein YbhN (UPF0104 family)
MDVKAEAADARRGLDRALGWLEEKPLVVIVAAAAATIGTSMVLASYAGWPHVFHVVHRTRSFAWLIVCFLSELVAYAGYILTVRDMARVEDGADIGIRLSTQAVVGGFGVFAATRGSGGFAVDYWAFRRGGVGRRDALARVLGLGFLEYLMLSIAALLASAVLFAALDGHASLGVTLPSLVAVPIFALAFWATSPGRAERLSRPRAGMIRRTLADSVAGARYVRTLLFSPREHGLGLVGNALYWTGDMVCLWAALQIVDAQITFAKLVLAYSGGYVLTRRALPLGGAGFVEVALTIALVGMGMKFVPALIGVIIYRLFNFWLPIIPALWFMPAIGDLRRRFRAAERRTV